MPHMPYAHWMIALAPLFMTIAAMVLENSIHDAETMANIGSFGATIAFCQIDVKQLRAAGYSNPPSAWWCLFSPVYLWKRGTLTGDRRPFWVLIGSFVVMFVIIIAAADAGPPPAPMRAPRRH